MTDWKFNAPEVCQCDEMHSQYFDGRCAKCERPVPDVSVFKTRQRRLWFRFRHTLVRRFYLSLRYVFGDGWGRSGQMVTIIAPWLAMAIVALPLSRLLSVLERQELKIVYDLASMIAIISVFSASFAFSMNVWMTLIGLSCAMVLAYVLYIGLAWYAVRSSDLSTPNP